MRKFPESWRQYSYGKLTGQDIENCIIVFRELWADRTAWTAINGDEAEWGKAVGKLMAVPNWTVFYQDSLLQLVGKVVVVAGISAAVVEAASSKNPSEAMLKAIKLIPEDPPDHPSAIPLAFAMIGNLDAIARYSRSINDMIEACKQGDVNSLFTALTVDSYLSTMPFFQAALRLGQLSGDSDAAHHIFRSIKGPHRKRLEYPELRWAEYLLRDQGAFQACSREEIYDLIVNHLGLYDPSGIKKDPKAGLFTLFRSWQKEAGIQNPRFGFSVKG